MNVTGTGIAVALAVTVALGVLAFTTPLFSSLFNDSGVSALGDAGSMSINQSAPTMELTLDPNQPLPTELVVTDVVVGAGPEATPGSMVAVQYTGALPDGTVFDSSIPRGEPFVFQLGAGQVIAGWDQGVAGMKVGGKRTLVIPPSLAYGDQAVGNLIPAGSTLLFEVELVAVQ